MDSAALQDKHGRPIGSTLVDRFGGAFRGSVIGRDDEGYAAARRVWNAHIDRNPGLVARCTGVADVVEAVGFARRNDLSVAVRGGGHDVGGRGTCDGGLVIDLSPMRGVYVDPADRTVRVQGGALLGDVDRETHLHGLAVPFGVVSKTGVGGLTLGGGMGWLLRRHGLALDNLLACEIVTADGSILTADAESHPDLFWGLRGGGGNFGVVTSFLFQAHPVSTVLGGMIIHPRERARDVIRQFRTSIPTAPEELCVGIGLIKLPDGTPAVVTFVCYAGDPAEGERLIRPFRDIGPALADSIQLMPFPAMQQILDEGLPDGGRVYWKSAFVDALDDGLIDLLLAQAERAPSPLSSLVIERFDGAASRVDGAATAFAQRKPSYNIQIAAAWMDPAAADAETAWARAAADAIAPFGNGGFFLNYLGDDEKPAIAAAFGPNLPRLRALKAKYDPENFFALNQNVEPRA